jgi:hypothetical protein
MALLTFPEYEGVVIAAPVQTKIEDAYMMQYLSRLTHSPTALL